MLSDTLMEEETLTSYAIRASIISGQPAWSSIKKCLLAENESSFKIFPRVNQDLANLYSKLVQHHTVEFLDRNHTLIPLFRPIARGQSLIWNYSSATHGGRRSRFLHGDNPLDEFETTYQPIKYCPQCFILQITNHGFTWFKREWQIPWISGCIEHRCKLISIFCTCPKGLQEHSEKSILSSLAGICVWCKKSLWNVEQHKMDDKFSIWLSKLLKANFPTFSRNQQIKLLEDAAARLSKKNGQIVDQNHQILAYADNRCMIAELLDSLYVWRTATNNISFPRQSRGFEERTRGFLYGHHPDSITLFCFFRPLSEAFTDFDNFIVHLKEHGYISNSFQSQIN